MKSASEGLHEERQLAFCAEVIICWRCWQMLFCIKVLEMHEHSSVPEEILRREPDPLDDEESVPELVDDSDSDSDLDSEEPGLQFLRWKPDPLDGEGPVPDLVDSSDSDSDSDWCPALR